MENSFTVEHHEYGIGTAILVSHRRERKDDLFMCSFRLLKDQRLFYCRYHFNLEEEVWLSNGKPKKQVKRQPEHSDLEETIRNMFSGRNPINS
jgi:hypothetical protein